MSYIRLVHWNADEAAERAEQLRSAGYDAVSGPIDPAALRTLRENPPLAVVFDLTRLPSHGRDAAVALRSFKATRHVPLIFVGGKSAKVERVKALLPDAVYTSWKDITGALAQAISHPPAEPVVPGSVLDAYAGTPLPKKLGIKAGSTVALFAAPQGFEETLGKLPDGVTLHRDEHSGSDISLWFVKTRAELEEGIRPMTNRADKGGLWILWPKRSSGVGSDLSQTVVRAVAMATGLVDFKVCSVDVTWSGLRFTRRSDVSR